MKFVSPGTTGVPDRIVMLPGGVIFFAELKRPGGAPSKRQELMARSIEKLGTPVFVIDCKEQVNSVLRGITKKGGKQNEI